MQIARVIKVQMRGQGDERKFCQGSHHFRNVAHAGAGIKEQRGVLPFDQVVPVDLVKARFADGMNAGRDVFNRKPIIKPSLRLPPASGFLRAIEQGYHMLGFGKEQPALQNCGQQNCQCCQQ